MYGACCIATEVFFANDGAVSRLRCRSKVAQKVALNLWNAPTSPDPSRQRNPSDSAYRLFGVYFERRKSMSSPTP